MMKSFFKKLAFVMALAMVVSMVAPAGSALAAEAGVSLQGTKTIVETYELKVGDSQDFSFQGAPKDWKTTSFWTTSNEAVATVDKMGVVTAVAAGTATITITAGADKSYNETVVITVPSGLEFTAVQTNTTDVVLTFAEGTDMSAVTVDDFAVTAIDETFEYTLFANEVKANKNVVTLGFVDGVLSDGATLKIAYKDADVTLVASNGDAVTANIHYGMKADKLAGDAFVYTDLDPDYVYLAYTLYDANGINVTANYDEDDFDNLEWSVANGDDIAYIDYDDEKNMDVVVFEEKGAASVKLEITFVDEDGKEEVISAVTPIVAKDRPAIAFTFEKAGLYDPAGLENSVAGVNSYNNYWGTIWQQNYPTASIVKGGNSWFGAALVDNRGDGLVSTHLTHEWDERDGWNAGAALDGDTEYGEYGYFTYTSSNDNVIDIDNSGYVTAIGTGSATILVSFVAYDEDGEELPAKKIGSKRISVYAEPYAASYSLTYDNTTVTTSGSSLTGSVYFQIFDQYGSAMTTWSGWSNDPIGNYLNVTATSETYEDVNFTIAENPVWEWQTSWTPAYKITFSGDEFTSLVDDGKYKTFKFDVELDKEMNDDFAKVSTKSDRAFVKVYNVNEYFADLSAFYAGDESVDVKVNYNAWLSDSYIDVWTDVRSEFGDSNSTGKAAVKWSGAGVDLMSGSGLKLMSLPEAYYIELPKENGKYIATKDIEDPVKGAIYWTRTYATKDKNNVTPTTGSSVGFSFNTVDSNDNIYLADLGNYTITLYTVNSRDKLVKLDTKTINVGSSMNKVTYEGFKDGNVWDGDLATADLVDVVTELCEFKWNGTLMSKSWADFEIAENGVTAVQGDGKVRITEIKFVLPVYDTENSDEGLDTYEYKTYTYKLKKNITIYEAE